MKKLIPFILSILICSSTAMAISLDEGKANGLVGERADGYLGAVSSSPDATALVNDINSKRRAKYSEIAKKNGTRIEAVEALAGEKAIANTPPGQYVQDKGGWRKK